MSKSFKTVKAFAAESNISEKLIRAVVRQYGSWEYFKEGAQNVCTHGANSGFEQFIYYTDTVPFFTRNRAEIIALAKDMADGLGENTISLIQGFNCLHGDYNADEIGATLYGPKPKADTQIANALAWFALEEVCRSYSDALEG